MRIRTALAALLVAACSEGSAPEPSPAATSAAGTTEPTPTATIATTSPTPAASASAAPAALTRAIYYDQAISPEDLQGRTLRELSLMRNTIFARAGNPFRRPWLDAYFRAQPWYAPLDKMDEAKITDLDRANARQIADFDAALPREALEGCATHWSRERAPAAAPRRTRSSSRCSRSASGSTSEARVWDRALAARGSVPPRQAAPRRGAEHAVTA